jgi:hypothetical protein
MLSEHEIGESFKIVLQSAISLKPPTFTSRTIFGKSDQYHIRNANFLQISLAIVQSLKGVALQMNPWNDHLNGQSWESSAVSPLEGIGRLFPTCVLSLSLQTESGSNCSGVLTMYWQTAVIQGVPPGHEHLNAGRIKHHSSMTFIWAYSIYSPLTAIHFLTRSIHSRKTACKVTFSIPSGTSSTVSRSWAASSNERPARHLLTYPKR